MGRAPLQYINLVDFTAGIHNRYGTALGHRPGFVADGNHDGSAQITGTYGCYGDPKGGLRPLPRGTNILSLEVEEDIAQPGGWPVGSHHRRIAILDISVMSPVLDIATGFTGPTPEALFVSYYWYRDQDGGAGTDFSRRALGRQHKLYKAGHPTYDLWDYFDEIDSDGELTALAYSMWFTSRAAYGIEDFEDPLLQQIGLAQMRGMISAFPSNEDTPVHRAFAFPANTLTTAPTVDGVNSPADEVQDEMGELAWFIGHQGRSVFVFRRTGPADNMLLEPFGLNGRLPIGEAISYSDVNFAFAKFEGDIFHLKTSWVEENPSGYGAIASVNASELFLVKNRGGGVVIRGGLDSPEVVRLPGVESVGGVSNIPAVTPYGCFYGTRSGVWNWQGGDSAQCVSPQLDGWFWDAEVGYEPGLRVGIRGRFSYSYPFLFAPNDWVMDVRTNGWFRLADRSLGDHPYMFYDLTWDGRIYASPGAIDIELDPLDEELVHSVVADVIDMEILVSTYQWVSQPFAVTLNKDVEIKSIVVVAQGVGTVKVIVQGLNAVSTIETFEFTDGSAPVRYEKPATSRVTDPTVTILVEADDDGDPAPIVHAVHLGYMELARIPQSDDV